MEGLCNTDYHTVPKKKTKKTPCQLVHVQVCPPSLERTVVQLDILVLFGQVLSARATVGFRFNFLFVCLTTVLHEFLIFWGGGGQVKNASNHLPFKGQNLIQLQLVSLHPAVLLVCGRRRKGQPDFALTRGL